MIADAAATAPIALTLLVGDEQCDELAAWLRDRGYGACVVRTIAEALNQLSLRSYQVLLVDLDLAGADSLALIQRMKAVATDLQVVVMSIAEWLRERAEVLEDLGVVEVFAKPIDMDEIEQLLIKIGREGRLPPWRAARGPGQTQPFPEFLAPAGSEDGLSQQLEVSLAHLVETARAELGIIFHMDLTSQAVSILAHVGAAPLAANAVYSLADSPVKDVIREKIAVFEKHVLASEHIQRRFGNLLALLEFQSCIGVPIEVQSQTNHALFLFHQAEDMATKPQDGRALDVTASYAVGARRIQIRFTDSGPGIHKQLWEKIFTLGFSTRPGGSGLGLFIARSLVGSLGGTVVVERSVIPIGTTFLVELRAAAP